MFASVAPLLKLPRTSTAFDYLVPKELEKIVQAGQQVSVPFRNRRSVRGVIIALKQKPFKKGVPLKPIKKIIQETPIAPWRLRLSQWLASYYHCSLGGGMRLVVKNH
jgi:primosomal protein N'